MLLSTFEQQISLKQEYYQLSGGWIGKLFALARVRGNPNFDQDIQSHLNKLWRLQEDISTI
jgi:hypothetical protein